MLYSSFTKEAKQAIKLARDEATGNGNEVATHHILLGLFQVDPVKPFFEGITYEEVKKKVSKYDIASDDIPWARKPFSESARKLLLDAVAMAKLDKKDYLGTEHLWAALAGSEVLGSIRK